MCDSGCPEIKINDSKGKLPGTICLVSAKNVGSRFLFHAPETVK